MQAEFIAITNSFMEKREIANGGTPTKLQLRCLLLDFKHFLPLREALYLCRRLSAIKWKFLDSK